jgi:hypothetical protein
MAFADEVAGDVEVAHNDWARTDVDIVERTTTAVSVTGSTPTFSENPDTLTGVFTVIDTALQETSFGGMIGEDATLLLLPAEDIAFQDIIEVDNAYYRVEEIRLEKVGTTEVQKSCRLVRINP